LLPHTKGGAEEKKFHPRVEAISLFPHTP